MAKETHYTILGLEVSATQREITKKYKKLCLTHHPDKGGNQQDFIKITKAYETLTDQEAKAVYDQSLNNSNDITLSEFLSLVMLGSLIVTLASMFKEKNNKIKLSDSKIVLKCEDDKILFKIDNEIQELKENPLIESNGNNQFYLENQCLFDFKLVIYKNDIVYLSSQKTLNLVTNSKETFFPSKIVIDKNYSGHTQITGKDYKIIFKGDFKLADNVKYSCDKYANHALVEIDNSYKSAIYIEECDLTKFIFLNNDTALHQSLLGDEAILNMV